jgi:hypothetical protein
MSQAMGTSCQESPGRGIGKATIGLILLGMALTLGAAQAAGRGRARLAGPEPVFAPARGGASAVAWNPALLAAGDADGIDLLRCHGTISNNSFSLGDYLRLNGAAWDDGTKAEVLGRVRGTAVTVDGAGSASLGGVSWRGFYLSTGVRAATQLAVPREALQILLDGNTVGHSFSLEGAKAQGILLSLLRLSWAYRLERPIGSNGSAGPAPILQPPGRSASP